MDIPILRRLRARGTQRGDARGTEQFRVRLRGRVQRCARICGRLFATAARFSLILWMAVFPFGSAMEARGILGPSPTAPSQAEIKAAFLLNFARFAEWSANSVPESPSLLLFCFDGAEDVRIAFQSVAGGKEITGRKIQAKISLPADARTCDVLFANDSKHDREAKLLKAAQDAGALTVGDGPDFLTCGGMIELVVDDNRMRFDINMAAVSRANLKLSSKLLALARHVIDLPVEAADWREVSPGSADYRRFPQRHSADMRARVACGGSGASGIRLLFHIHGACP